MITETANIREGADFSTISYTQRFRAIDVQNSTLLYQTGRNIVDYIADKY